MTAAAALLLPTAVPAVAAQASGHILVKPQASAARPTVIGPVIGGLGMFPGGTTFSLSDVGYKLSEYFLSGTATSYKPAAPLGSDGKWQATPASTASYTTRIVVNRPTDPAKFNGTVVVEWLNDTGGIDEAADWISGHNELIREGYAWVGVSAQAAGIKPLKVLDPLVYLLLSHPGDSYSYDMFSQAGQAIRADASRILGGLQPRTFLAEGESQSAFRLTTYINAIQPLVNEYDGFLVHSRGGSAAPLSQSPQADVLAPTPVLFRPDAGVPVLAVETESDLFMPTFSTFPGSGPYLPARQADSAGFRLWEVAGTAHADDYLTNIGPGDSGDGAADAQGFNNMLKPPSGIPLISCNGPINTGPQHYVIDAAEYALNRWVTTGTTPSTAARLQVNTAGTGFVLDADGNVKGGIRTPAVETPVATLSGLGNSGSDSNAAFICGLLGTTTPFNATKLTTLYPTHTQFVTKWTNATNSAVAAGFIRPADATQLITAARTSSVGG